MTEKWSHLSAREIRDRLAFDVDRLRSAAQRLDAVDGELKELKSRLEARVRVLSREASGAGPVFGGDGTAQIKNAQAHATATLAGRSALGEVLRSSSPLSLIVAMATSRWLGALRSMGSVGPESLRSHIEAGRIAHRLLAILRRKDDLRSGTGKLVSAVVIAEFARPDLEDDVAAHIEEGLQHARSARGVRSDDDAIAAASRALRAARELLDGMADRAEPAARALLDEADGVEEHVAHGLRGRMR